MKNQKEKNEKLEEIFNKINVKFIFEFSRKCYEQVKLMEYMLKEERFRK
jgi:hypothetical protein